MEYYFCSDNHFNHSQILIYTNRKQFIKEGDLINNKWVSQEIAQKRTEEMDKYMIREWNNRVKKDDDVVIHGGDLLYKGGKDAIVKKDYNYYKKQLNGDLVLLDGNHNSKNGVKSIIRYMVIKYGGQKMFMVHDPKFANLNFEIVLHGHWHGKYGKCHYFGKNCIGIDLSVECWNYRPVTINEILSAIAKFKKETRNKAKIMEIKNDLSKNTINL